MMGLLRCGVILSVLAMSLAPAQAQLRGHGGPVRALAISPDGKSAVSGSFDTSAIRWSLARNVAEQVMRFHDGAVNAVALLKDGRIVTAGEDAHIAIWTPGRPAPDAVLDGHSGPIASLGGVAGRHDTGVGVVGSQRPAVAARRRRAARARRPCAGRQQRRLFARRPRAGERGLRRQLAHLAARRRRDAIIRNSADAAQRGRGRARRRDRHRRRQRQGVLPVAARATCAPRSKPPRFRSSALRSRPTANWSRPPASAARWR